MLTTQLVQRQLYKLQEKHRNLIYFSYYAFYDFDYFYTYYIHP